ncbi:MAG: hypothetical protein H8E44_11740 [Planctomycetes bacterium]|nr:hypothetical protein [Planctomycetota bacterium]MBL7043315.1 hypothetical protein [Pirellulaceae bacterium]
MNTPTDRNSKAAKYRQYVLLGAMLVVGTYFGGTWLLETAVRSPLEEARSKTKRLTDDIKKREKALAKVRDASVQLATWEGQSLPGNMEVARSLYQAWLVELVNDVRLLDPSVNSSEPVGRKGLYHTLGYSVRGRGTLDQLTMFLFAFYQTDLLHQIRSLNITPLAQGSQLDLSVTIEALVLDHVAARSKDSDQQTAFDEFRLRSGATKDKETDSPRVADRLASDKLEDYAIIAQRNIFGMGGGGIADPTDHTYLTSISIVNNQPEVWLTDRTTDKVHKVRQGDVFEVGPLVCTIAEVYGSDVIIESDGERWLLTLGDKLTDAHALPPEY